MNLDTITCADIFDLCATVPDGAVDMILCDLPYGTTACTWDTVIPFEPMWKAFKRIIKPRGAIVLTASQPFTSALVMSNPGMFRYQWYWKKERPTGFNYAKYQPMRILEDVCVFSDSPCVYYAQKERHKKAYRHTLPIYKSDSARMTSSGIAADGARIRKQYEYQEPTHLIEFARDFDTPHPTQKPVALFEYLIRTYTQPGELVFDPCCGSGTTAIAARRCERHFICGDSSPEYVAIANERLQNTDPFQDRKVSQNVVQHSLFQGMAE